MKSQTLPHTYSNFHGQTHESIHDQFIWTPTEKNGVGTREVPIDVVYNADIRNGTEIVTILPGYGEELASSLAAVRKMGERGLEGATIILPFDKAKLPDLDWWWIDKVLKDVPTFAAQQFNKIGGRSADEPVDTFGRSQGVSVALAAREAPEMFRAIELKGPMGIDNESLGGTEKQRIHTFVRSMLINAFARKEQSIFYDWRNLIAGREIFTRAAIDLVQRRFGTKVGYAAMTKELVPTLVELEDKKGEDVKVWLNKSDPVVPEANARDRLREAGIEHIAETVSGSHMSLLTRGNNPGLDSIAAHIKERRAAHASKKQ